MFMSPEPQRYGGGGNGGNSASAGGSLSSTGHHDYNFSEPKYKKPPTNPYRGSKPELTSKLKKL